MMASLIVRPSSIFHIYHIRCFAGAQGPEIKPTGERIL
jgi:hypothetical protein